MAHSHFFSCCLEQALLGRRFVHRRLGPVSLRGTCHPVSGSCQQRIRGRRHRRPSHMHSSMPRLRRYREIVAEHTLKKWLVIEGLRSDP
jgi:hypothetical protein